MSGISSMMLSSYKVPAAGGGANANTVILFHFDGANNSTTFTDSSTNAWGFTRTAWSGISGTDQTISTIDPKFGTGSFRNNSNGGNAKGLYQDPRTFSGGSWIPTDLQMSTDFTVEAYIKLPTTGAGADLAAWFGIGATRFNAIFFLLQTTNPKLTVEYNPGSSNYGSGYKSLDYSFNTSKVNVWTHFALVRSGNALTLYVDGTAVQPSGYSTFFSGGSPYVGTAGGITGNVAVADIGGQYIDYGLRSSSMDEFRWSKTAVYTSNFTAPSSAFTG
jgi:hypothetical protein